MDDFDDPIADLLSEGDSFFEDPKLLAKKTTPKKTTKVAADIFGFDTDSKPITVIKEPATSKNDDWLGLGSTKNDDKSLVKETPSTEMKTKKIESKLSFEKDDVNSILGLNASEPKTVASKKSSILSEILGDTPKPEDKKLSTFDDILQSSSARKRETISSTSIPETTTSTVSQSQLDFTPGLARESRRGRRNSPGIIDPLGIFESQKKDNQIEQPDVKTKESKKIEKIDSEIHKPKIVTTPEKKLSTDVFTDNKSQQSTKGKSSGLPNWLGGNEITPKSSSTKQIIESTTPEDAIKKVDPPVNQPEVITNTENISSLPNHLIESLFTQQKISSSHMELQNASLALQQQESQLMIAVQLKKYEDSLAEMQKRQQEMLLKQDVQFNSLLERQFAKQHVMENNMRIQQERINNHIQLLLSHPSGSTGTTVVSEEQQHKNDYIKNTFEENRKFYDDIIGSLKQKHQEEIFLLEESYKKQLSFLESSLESTEKRLKTEIDSINKHFNEKLEDISIEKETLISKYEEKIKALQEQNLNDIETIKENCKQTVSDIRNEYKQMLDDLSQSKIKQNETIAEAEDITKKVDASLEMLHGNTQIIHDMQTKITEEHNLLAELKSENLNAKEAEIKMMKTRIEKDRLAMDGERGQLLALVRSLETRLVEQTQAAREERWALQQATATMAARSMALDREADFVRKNLERERDQAKTLKETLLAEHQQMILKLTEEKLAIAAEKSRLDTSAKINQNFDSSKAKAEIEAAIKVAKEATELTDKERENLCKQQCEIETMKRNLHDRESKLAAKEQELEKLFHVADRKYHDGESALTEAKLTEHKYTERLKDIQKQLSSLAAREKKLTEEKIALSKERVSLHSQMKDNKKCSLCQTDNYKNDFRGQTNFGEQNLQWGTDAEILRIKYDLENDNIVSKEQSIAENDSES